MFNRQSIGTAAHETIVRFVNSNSTVLLHCMNKLFFKKKVNYDLWYQISGIY